MRLVSANEQHRPHPRTGPHSVRAPRPRTCVTHLLANRCQCEPRRRHTEVRRSARVRTSARSTCAPASSSWACASRSPPSRRSLAAPTRDEVAAVKACLAQAKAKKGPYTRCLGKAEAVLQRRPRRQGRLRVQGSGGRRLGSSPSTPGSRSSGTACPRELPDACGTPRAPGPSTAIPGARSARPSAISATTAKTTGSRAAGFRRPRGARWSWRPSATNG